MIDNNVKERTKCVGVVFKWATFLFISAEAASILPNLFSVSRKAASILPNLFFVSRKAAPVLSNFFFVSRDAASVLSNLFFVFSDSSAIPSNLPTLWLCRALKSYSWHCAPKWPMGRAISNLEINTFASWELGLLFLVVVWCHLRWVKSYDSGISRYSTQGGIYPSFLCMEKCDNLRRPKLPHGIGFLAVTVGFGHLSNPGNVKISEIPYSGGYFAPTNQK